MNEHAKGLLLTALGVLIISPDTLLIRLADMDVWTLALWRSLLQAFGTAGLLACFYGRRTPEVFLAIGATGALLAILFAANTLVFLIAVQNTKVANALVILATAPFFAAATSYLFLKEGVAPRTWAALLAALCGVAVIVWDGLGQGTLFGDAMALVAAILLGSKFTIIRRRRAINMIPAMALSGLIAALIALPFSSPTEVVPEQMLWIGLMDWRC